uniref:C2H2-type domain-containing protein n=1 Tax=Anopheles arabiensis TaxID=7173 RepID=A0A182HNU6_ANOAR
MNNFLDITMQRFRCSVCDKSYLRKRHLQRHMRDECIGIPPRFHCDHCDSKFRRKYHLVRHMLSKHGIQMEPGPMKPGSGGSGANGGGSGSGTEGDGSEMKYVKLAAEAGNGELATIAAAAAAAAAAANTKGGKGGGKGSRAGTGAEDSADEKFSMVDTLMVKQEEIEPVSSQTMMYQNFKNLFFDYALKNVPAPMHFSCFSDLSKFLNAVGRYECPRRDCDKNYKDASSLQRHIRYECGGMKKFRCVMCGKAFSQGSHLKRHLESGVCIKYYF